MATIRERRERSDANEEDRLAGALLGVKALLESATVGAFARSPRLRGLAGDVVELLASLSDAGQRQVDIDLSREIGGGA